jgi:hypothetical protein
LRLIIATFTGTLTLLAHTIRFANHATGSILHPIDRDKSKFATMGDATEPNMSIQDSPFLALAEELVLSITSHIPRKDLCALALVSKKCHRLATPLIWKEVELIDCRSNTDGATGNRVVTYGPITAAHRGRNILAGVQLGSDEHDDTPLIKILLTLAT